MKLKLHVLLSVVGIFLLSLSAFAFSIQNKTVAAGKQLTLAGSVFFDANNNGVRDAKENDLVTRAGNEPFTVEIYNASGDYLEAIANADNEWVLQSTTDFPIVAGENYVLFVYSFNDASVKGFPTLYPTTQNVGSDDSVDSDFTTGFHCGSNGGKKYKGKLNFNPGTIEDVLNLNLGLIDGAKVVNEDQCTTASSSSSNSSVSSVVSSSSSSLAMCLDNQLVYNNTTPLCYCDLTGGMYQLAESNQGVICVKKPSSSSSSSSIVSSSSQAIIVSSKSSSSSNSAAFSVSSTSSAVSVISSSSVSSAASILAANSSSNSAISVSSSSKSNNSGVLSFVSSTSTASNQNQAASSTSNKTGVLSFVSSAANTGGALSATGLNIVLLIIGAIAIALCGIAIMFITRKN